VVDIVKRREELGATPDAGDWSCLVTVLVDLFYDNCASTRAVAELAVLDDSWLSSATRDGWKVSSIRSFARTRATSRTALDAGFGATWVRVARRLL